MNVFFEGGELASGWHNIELIMTITDDPEEFCVDVYLDDEFLVSSADYYHGTNPDATPATSVPVITFKLLRQLTGDVYLDNVTMAYE